MSPTLLLFVSAAPLLAAFTAWSHLGRRLLPVTALLSLIPAFAAALLLPSGTQLWLAKGHLEVVWALDDLGRTFLWFSAAGWALAAAYAVGYLRNHPRRTNFWILFLLSMSGNLLLVTGVDALTYYTGFAVMGFAAWGLVAFEATPASLRASRIYLGMVVLGELLVLPGLVKGVLGAESTRLAAIQLAWGTDAAAWLAVALLLVGFGIKAGMVPFHFWLPLAHPAAPTPASAVLSGCMIKAGLLGWLRLLPVEGEMLPFLAAVFAAAGFINLVGGGLMGITQASPKAALAYSSLQAMGTMMLMLAAVMWNPSLREVALPLIAAYAFFHALHKVTLFLAVGVVPSWSRHSWVARLLLSLVALSYAGLPGLAGDRVKEATKLLWEAVPQGVSSLWGWGINIGAVLTVVIMARVIWMVRPGRESSQTPAWSSALVWIGAAHVALLFIFLPVSPPFSWPPSLVGVFSLAVGGLIGIALSLSPLGERIALPPGDLGVLLERISVRGFSKIGDWSNALEVRIGGPAAALCVFGLLISLLLFVLRPG